MTFLVRPSSSGFRISYYLEMKLSTKLEFGVLSCLACLDMTAHFSMYCGPCVSMSCCEYVNALDPLFIVSLM